MRVISTTELPTTVFASELEQQLVYCGLDTLMTHKLEAKLQEMLAKDSDCHRVYKFERLMLGPIMTMMRRGIKINRESIPATLVELGSRVTKLRKTLDIFARAIGWEAFYENEDDDGEKWLVNANSGPQLKQLLFSYLKIPVTYRSDKGVKKISLDEDALKLISKHYVRGKPFAEIILRIREIEGKLKVLETKLAPGGRWAASYNLAGTTTGRLSSSEHPLYHSKNVQNITDELRQLFVPDPGYIIVNFDLQGAEARDVAYESEDVNYIRAVESEDVHTFVAADVFDIPPTRQESDKKYEGGRFSFRDLAKRCSHGCVTADHEVLTKEGWKPIAESRGHDILIYNKETNSTKFELPSMFTEEFCQESLISIEGQALSLCATKNHRVLYSTDEEGFHVAEAASLPKSAQIQKTANYSEGIQKYLTENGLRLLAAYHSDGSPSRKNMRFKFRKVRKIERIKLLLDTEGLLYHVRIEGKNTVITTKQTWLPSLYCGKQLAKYCFDWSGPNCKIYIDEYSFWDGYKGPTGHIRLMTVNKDHAQWLQIVAYLAGYSGHWGQEKHGTGFNPNATLYNIQINKRKKAHLKSCKYKEIPGNQMIYCPTVSTGFFVVRRKNHIHITGNSNYNGKPRTIAIEIQVPTNFVERFQLKYFKKFRGIKTWHNDTAVKIQTDGYLITPMGFKRHFWGYRYADETLREGLALGPQNTICYLTLIALYLIWFHLDPQDAQLLGMIHDAVVIQIKKERLELIAQIIKMITVAVPVKGRSMTIPWECQTGANWGKWDAKKNPTGLDKFELGEQ